MDLENSLNKFPDYKIGDMLSFYEDRTPTHVIIEIIYFKNSTDIDKFKVLNIYPDSKAYKATHYFFNSDLSLRHFEDSVWYPVGHNSTVRLLYGK